jgi:hypothetical protein
MSSVNVTCFDPEGPIDNVSNYACGCPEIASMWPLSFQWALYRNKTVNCRRKYTAYVFLVGTERSCGTAPCWNWTNRNGGRGLITCGMAGKRWRQRARETVVLLCDHLRPSRLMQSPSFLRTFIFESPRKWTPHSLCRNQESESTLIERREFFSQNFLGSNN